MFLHGLPSLKTVLDSYRVENEAMISNKPSGSMDLAQSVSEAFQKEGTATRAVAT